MTGRRALIFGVSGQDGSYMAELLGGKGYDVVGTSRDPNAAERLELGVEIAAADLRDASAINALIDRVSPDEIYNFAAYSTGSGMYDLPVEIGDINGLAVARILDAIRRHRRPIRFCQASSSEMFGATRSSPQNEDTPFLPRSPYGAAKLFAHNLIGIARQRDAVFACSAILFNHESPRRTHAFVTRKITRAAASIAGGLTDQLVLGDLSARRDWGYAGDVVHAMWLMLQADRADDYVIATGVTHSVAELCEIAFAHAGLDWTKYVRVDDALKRSPDSVQLVGDPTRARQQLGWTTSVTFEDMIKDMVNADLCDLQDDTSNKRKIS